MAVVRRINYPCASFELFVLFVSSLGPFVSENLPENNKPFLEFHKSDNTSLNLIQALSKIENAI